VFHYGQAIFEGFKATGSPTVGRDVPAGANGARSPARAPLRPPELPVDDFVALPTC
jgi:hypothetical protein